MKKLLVSLLAAGLVLPSAAALAQEEADSLAEIDAALAKPTKEELKLAEDKATEDWVKAEVEKVADSKDAGVKLEDGTRVFSPTGEVLVDKAGVETAKEEVAKEEVAKKDAAVEKAVAKKGMAKAGKKALPKTSAVK